MTCPRTAAVAALMVVGALTAGCGGSDTTPQGAADGATTTTAEPAPAPPWYCASTGNGTPVGGHGNGHQMSPVYADETKGALSDTDCAALTEQVDALHAATSDLETKGAAEAAGWVETAEYLKGVGTHHSKGAFPLPAPGEADSFHTPPFDPATPMFLIYGGESADAPLVGVAYQFIGKGDPPPAFAGTNDWWHEHNKTCIGAGGKILAGAEEIPDTECTEIGGHNIVLTGPGGIFGNNGNWLLHMWLAPHEYRPDAFASGHPCMLDTAIAPSSDPCWEIAHRDAAAAAAAEPDMSDMDHSSGDPHGA